ncbi:FeoB-associated Cys-rich membrane protein [Clostridium sp. Marseille-P2415]|nr:FeoB-associated Cys-rich membrane protein [Clostridium sp. Marseille-P2415]
MGTLVVLIAVIGMVALAVKSMIRDKKNGKSIQCGGECGNCGGHCCH